VPPRALAVIAEAIPELLRAVPSWVVWRYVPSRNKKTGEVEFNKPPVNARTGGPASSTDPKTWSDHVVVLTVYGNGGLDGVGFCLHHETGATEAIVAIDLDHCRDPQTGAVEPWAQAIIDAIRSYTEVSPSGAGIRIFLRGRPLQRGRKRGPVEVYCRARYVTVTGHHVEGTPLTVEARPEALDAFMVEHFPEPSPSRQNGHAKGGQTPTDLDDAELVRKAGEAKNGARFKSLWSGSWDGAYPSQSEADAALCGLLAFWAGPDAARIDRLFRQSGLYRAKWDRPQYREDTIALAIQGKTEFYDPGRSAGLKQGRARRRHADGTDGPHGENGRADDDGAPAEERPHLTDRGNAMRLVRESGQDLRHCLPWREWLVWGEGQWQHDDTAEATRRAKWMIVGLYGWAIEKLTRIQKLLEPRDDEKT
jgi:primase-polymerase (primpol)-like protein